MPAGVEAINCVEARRLLLWPDSCELSDEGLGLSARGIGSLCEASPSSICSCNSVRGVEGASESEVSSSVKTTEAAEERGDCDVLIAERCPLGILIPGTALGSIGIGLSG